MISPKSINNGFNYAPAPFWFLNHRLEKDEIRRQLRLMKETEVSGFFIHPRAGLLTPYGSAEWHEMVKFIVSESEKLGLKAWLYDEDPFPSGIAGGKVVFDNPEFKARGIKFARLFPAPDSEGKISGLLGETKIIGAIAIRKERNGRIIEQKDQSRQIGILRKNYFKSIFHSSYYRGFREEQKYEHLRAETFFPEMAFETKLAGEGWMVIIAMLEEVKGGSKFGCWPDNLNKKCVQSFINATHERYSEYLGDKFGGIIPGIFTDESSAGGGRLPWTDSLEDEFLKEHGQSLTGNIFHLAENLDENSREIRRKYWETVNRLFEENFFGQIRDWCSAHNLLLCGHPLCEEEPDTQILLGANLYSVEKVFDIPGFDHITPNIADRQHPSLNFGGKMVASAAHQKGIRPVLCESFGCNAFNFGMAGLLQSANWLFSLGITWLVPHGFYYSYDGNRKFDAGKSFFFQDPGFPDFKKFVRYAARTGGKLAGADHESDLCLVIPTGAFREFLPVEKEAADKLTDRIYEMVRILLEEHIEFDIIDDCSALKAPIEKGRLLCGKESYKVMLLPITEEMSPDYLERFARIKGKISAFFHGLPAVSKIRAEHPALTSVTNLKSGNDFSGRENLICLRKRTKTSKIIFIFNNSVRPGLYQINDEEEHPFAYSYDAFDDKYYSLKTGDGKIAFAVEGFKAALIEFRKKKINNAGSYSIPDIPGKTRMLHIENPEWDYTPPVGIAAAINNWDVEVKGKYKSFKAKNRHFCLVRDLLGTELDYLKEKFPRPHFDTAEYENHLYPAHAVFKAVFKVEEKSGCVLLFENDTFHGNFTLSINGIAVPPASFRREKIYDPFNLTAEVSSYIKTGKNKIRVEWLAAREFDGIKSSIYLMEK